jgi:hypothetical protein
VEDVGDCGEAGGGGSVSARREHPNGQSESAFYSLCQLLWNALSLWLSTALARKAGSAAASMPQRDREAELVVWGGFWRWRRW